MREAENNFKIEGILSSVELERKMGKRGNEQDEMITGKITVKVRQKINKVDTDLDVPVHIFAYKHTKTGGINPAFEQAAALLTTDFVSIAAGGEAAASRVRITGAQLTMNEYYRNDVLHSDVRVRASFIRKISAEECHPAANGILSFMIGDMGYELDKDGVETNKYKITALVPGWGDRVDVVPLYAINPGVIDGVSNAWNKNDTVKANITLNFCSRTETVTEEVDFGEPIVRERTVSISEPVVTGGSSVPLEGELAYSVEDMQAALARRQAALKEQREKAQTRQAQAQAAPAAPAKASVNLADFGF